MGGPVLSRSAKSEVRVVSPGVVEKRYLTDDASKRVKQDVDSLEYLGRVLGDIEHGAWSLRVVRVLGPGEDGDSVLLEHIPGTLVSKLEGPALLRAENLYGVWLGEYGKRVLDGGGRGRIFADPSLHNAIFDAEGRQLVVFDPGEIFGREAHIYEDVLLHIESILACCARRRLNPVPLVREFLAGYQSTGAPTLDPGEYLGALLGVKWRMIESFYHARPGRLPVYAAVTVASLPLYLWYVPMRLSRD